MGSRVRALADRRRSRCPGTLSGSYFETCSCDVVCPCTASLALGATKDRCKVVLVFNMKDGEVSGVDVERAHRCRGRRHPEGDERRQLALGVVIDAAASDEQAEELGGVFSGALGGPMESLGPLIGENLGLETAADRGGRGQASSTRFASAKRSTSRSRMSSRSVSGSGEPAKLTGIFHPVGSELTGRGPRGRASTPSASSTRRSRRSRAPSSPGQPEARRRRDLARKAMMESRAARRAPASRPDPARADRPASRCLPSSRGP